MGKLEKKLLKSQTGHLTDSMLAHYGEHQTESDRKTIQAMAVKTIGGMLTSGATSVEEATVCGLPFDKKKKKKKWKILFIVFAAFPFSKKIF
jgi:hypothetical protein